jgi:guanylate kinase
VDYYFLAGPVFAQMLAAGQFLEHAMVYGHYYGVARQEVATDLDDNKDALLSVDVQGAATIRAEAERWPQLRRSLVTVFLMPSSPKVLAERLRKRDQDTPEVIQHRLQAAQAEMARWPEFDYLVPSTTMEEDLRRVQVIYEAEKMRPARAPGPGLPKRT